MKLARQLERRLEDALDGLAGRIFRGGLQVPELTARLAREAELAEFKTPAGPATANHFRLLINPANLEGGSERVSTELSDAFAAHAAERGWRLEGPVTVTIGPSPSVGVGLATCEATVVPGQLSTWATLSDRNGGVVPIQFNRALIGRSTDADVVINAPEVSRLHALIYRQYGEAYVVDRASANGTAIDGVAVKKSPVRLPDGSVLTLANLDFRFQKS
ncbi:MAG TPA: FhaA domain-containing protein [Acidimicrobiia bacterium]|nr:FhaA domain-containing protein [Acidimicrobiia bacterium]